MDDRHEAAHLNAFFPNTLFKVSSMSTVWPSLFMTRPGMLRE
jgi:hypothetical protein